MTRTMETGPEHPPIASAGILSARRLFWLLVILVSVAGIFDHDLWNPHEHRVGGMVREMIDTGDYLVPHLGGLPLFHKPPLFYASGALLIEALPTEPARTLRLVTLIYSLLAVAAVARLGLLLGGRRVALASSIVYVGNLGVLHTSHLVFVDAGLVAFTTGAFWAFVECRRGFRGARWFFWISLGGAFLTKGFVGPALVVPAVVVYLLRERDFRGGIRMLAPVRGMMVAGAVVALWAVPLYLRDGGQTLWAWFMSENVGRFFAEQDLVYHHDEPGWFYGPGLVLMFAPWILWLLVGAWRRLRGTLAGNQELERLAVVWFVTGFILLSLSRTKREIYIVPLLPAVSLLVAAWFVRVRHFAGRASWTWIFGGLVIAAVPICAGLGISGHVTFPRFWLSFPLATALAAGTILLIRRNQTAAFWLTPAIVYLQATILIIAPADAAKSHRVGMQQVAATVGERELASWRLGESLTGSLSFEIGRQAKDMRRPRALREYLSAGGESTLLVRLDRWPFSAPPDESFPGYITQVRISDSESLVLLRPTSEAAPLVTRRKKNRPRD